MWQHHSYLPAPSLYRQLELSLFFKGIAQFWPLISIYLTSSTSLEACCENGSRFEHQVADNNAEDENISPLYNTRAS